MVHIKVPAFEKHSKRTLDQATRDIWDTCDRQGKRHVYEANCDMHPSDRESKRESDLGQQHEWHTFHLKYMIYAHEQMFEMYEIAKHA